MGVVAEMADEVVVMYLGDSGAIPVENSSMIPNILIQGHVKIHTQRGKSQQANPEGMVPDPIIS